MGPLVKLLTSGMLGAFVMMPIIASAFTTDIYNRAKCFRLYSEKADKGNAYSLNDRNKKNQEAKGPDSTIIPPELLAVKTISRKPDLYLAPGELESASGKNEDFLLVDVRPANQYNQFKIPGSINLPLFTLKTKAFLKTKKVILIDQGHSYTKLEQACESLRASGFFVWILNGGLNYWRQRFGSLDGDVFAQSKLGRLSSREFFEAKHHEDWIIIDTSKTQNEASRTLFPNSVQAPFSKSDVFASRIAEITLKSQNNLSNLCLILNEDGLDYEKIEHLLNNSGMKNFFFLEGGINQYRRFLENQVRIWQQSQKPKVNLQKCPSCP